MAEAVAAISFISAIAGLVDIGTRVVARLNDFQSKTHQVPDVLKHVKVQLPLTIDSLCRSKARAESGELGTETQNALLPTLRACTELVARLDQILIQLLPVKSDSSWEKKMKALRSLTKDTDIQNLLQELDRYIAILTLHNTSASNPTSIPPMQSRRARARTIPTNRDASFVDRPDLFRSLQIHLDKHGRAALSGIGGVGKTQIAIEHCYRHLESHAKAEVFWIYGASVKRLGESCKGIAETLELPGWNDPKTNPMQLLCTFLAKIGTVQDLVVLDNVDNITILEEDLNFQNATVKYADFVRQLSSARILLTTRDRRVGERLAARGATIDVQSMALAESERLLRAHLSFSENGNSADHIQLVESLDCLPLAITQAAAYVVEGCISIQEYLSMLGEGDDQLEELLNESLSDERRIFQESNSPIKTWKISFDHILKIDKRASEMLSLMAVFDRNQIQDFLLQRETESRREFLKAVATLQNFSLVSKTAESNTYKMHRLVQVATQAWLRVHGSVSNVKREAVTIMATRFPSGEYETWRDCEALLPHARLLISQSHDFSRVDISCARLLSKVAWFHRCQGHYRDGITIARQARDIFQHLNGQNDPNALSNIVTEFDCRMQLFENVLVASAEEEFTNSVVSLQEQLGLRNPEALRGLGNLAFALFLRDGMNENIPEEAISLLRKVLSLREKVLGFDHPATMTTMNNLAMALDLKRQLAHKNDLTEREIELLTQESEELFRECLLRRQKHLGPDHPHTLEIQGNLGACLVDRRSFDEGEALLRSTISSRAAILGPSNADSISSMTFLIRCLHHRGSIEESIQVGREGLATAEMVFGPAHRETFIFRDYLAGDLLDTGQFADALKQWQLTLIHGRELIPGKDPESINSIVRSAAWSIVYLALDEGSLRNHTSGTTTRVVQNLVAIMMKGTSGWHRKDLDDIKLLRVLRHASILTLQNTDPLPEGWEVRLSSTYNVYFANTQNRATSWLDPRSMKSDLEQDDPAIRQLDPPSFYDKHVAPDDTLYGLAALDDESGNSSDSDTQPGDYGSISNSDLSEENHTLVLRTQEEPYTNEATRSPP